MHMASCMGDDQCNNLGYVHNMLHCPIAQRCVRSRRETDSILAARQRGMERQANATYCEPSLTLAFQCVYLKIFNFTVKLMSR